MKKNKTLKILGVIVLLIVLHLWEYSLCARKLYAYSYETLSQQLRVATSYYLRNGQEDIGELENNLLELDVAVSYRVFSMFPNRTHLLYEKFDSVTRQLVMRTLMPEDIPYFYDVLNKISIEVSHLVTSYQVNNISEAQYDKITKLLDELLEITTKVEIE
ncbi:hypothetical protein [Fusibacter sp. 3D3]|uniref:hypothetical protein n=1 Tax=Fusibacter sp. 3D3 TaxID=1048380 RepID=UPI00085347C2|nr:hypothetical protein [Fusibacter sp. 3D3]GAU75866.1 hypothetical protein F3D3_0462 [Fusibacter sp. 3D3]